MMPSVNAAAPPVEKFSPVTASVQRATHKDRSDDSDSFHNLLRKSREEHPNDSSNGEPAAQPASSDVRENKSSAGKDAGARKKEKTDKADVQTTVDVIQPATEAQPKLAPFQALLTLISASQPVQNKSEDAVSPDVENSGPANLPPPVPIGQPIASTAVASTKDVKTADVKTADVKTADVKTADVKTEDVKTEDVKTEDVKTADVKTEDVKILSAGKEKQTAGQSLAVPLSFDPILLAGISWRKDAVVASAASGGSTSPSTVVIGNPAAPNQATAGDLPVLSTQQNPEPMAAALLSKTLAFAVRLGSVTQQPLNATKAPDAPPPSVKILLENNGVSLIEKGADQAEKDHTGDSSSSGSNTFGAAYADAGLGLRTSSEKASFSEATQDVKAARADDLSAPANNSDPLRNILLQLKSDDNRRVDVRLIDRGGELHVSVKSADPALAQQLQEHMPELSSRLIEQQFNHDVWMPKLSEVNKSESSNNNGSSFNENGSQSNQPNSSESARRQNSGGQSRPDWVDLLENQIG